MPYPLSFVFPNLLIPAAPHSTLEKPKAEKRKERLTLLNITIRNSKLPLQLPIRQLRTRIMLIITTPSEGALEIIES